MTAWLSPKRFIAALLVSAALLTVAGASATTPKRVLLVFQNDGYSPAGWELQQSILSHVRTKLGQNVEFFCEQLEATRFPESQDQALSWVRSRYASRNIDVVIFLGSFPVDVLPGVPTVHAGFGPMELPKDASSGSREAALRFGVDFGRTIAVARRLQPNANKVLVITAPGHEDRLLLDEVREQFKDLELPVEYSSDASVDELQQRVAHLPRDTIVLPISYTRDLKGNFFQTPEVVTLLSRVSAAPIYAVADTAVGRGAVGGSVVRFEKMGSVVADGVVRMLAGNVSESTAVPPEIIAAYVFDWRELKRWGLSEDDLPPGSIVEFKTPTLWEQYRWRIIGIAALILVQSFLIIGLLINRSHRRKAQASLREMAGRLLESQDEERRRIARDLHDGTGQHLSGMALTIGQVLADFPPGHDRLRRLLEDSHVASRQALNEVRTVSYVLHPPILDGLGLVPALRWYLDGLEKRTSLKIDFEASSELNSLSPEAERALFRIVQESVTNVLRHSGATAIRVTLSNLPAGVSLEIEDNGHGMSPEEFERVEGAATLGVGIAGMRERVHQLGGSFQIQSRLIGTRVLVEVAAEEVRYVANSAGR